MVEKLGCKRTVPFMRGKIEIWAVGITSCNCTVNFLLDKSFEPYVSVHDICGYFGTQSTTSQKSKIICDMLKMGYFDGEFATQRSVQSNPLNNLLSTNGFIVPVDFLKDYR